MSDVLQQLMAEIQQKEAEAARLQAELAELNTALRVLQRMGGIRVDGVQESARDVEQPAASPREAVQEEDYFGPISTPDYPELDLSGATIAACCCTILREHEQKGHRALHYREIALEAKRRGYQGRSDKALEDSFWATLNRKPELFRQHGNGRYSLAERTKRRDSED